MQGQEPQHSSRAETTGFSKCARNFANRRVKYNPRAIPAPTGTYCLTHCSIDLPPFSLSATFDGARPVDDLHSIASRSTALESHANRDL